MRTLEDYNEEQDNRELYQCPECGHRETRATIEGLLCDVACPRCEEVSLADFIPMEEE